MNSNAQHLTFFVAGEEYALPILNVREIIEFSTLTVVPNTPAAVRGVINLRGSVVPVVDLAVRFGLPPATPGHLTCIVVVDHRIGETNTIVGLMADTVSQVIDLPPTEIQPVPEFGTIADSTFLAGLGRSAQKFVLLLDLPRVLDLQLAVSDPSASVAEQNVDADAHLAGSAV